MNGQPRHPSDGALAAFLDGKLAPDEIAYVADHLRGCGECRLVVSETARFEREEAPLEAPAPIRHVWKQWWKQTVAAAAAVVAITVPLVVRYIQSDARLIPRLIAAAPRDHRFIEPRLSGFHWARLQAPLRGQALVHPGDLKLKGIAGEVMEKAEERESAEADRARGVALLLIERPEESIAALEEAARASNDARAWNDLAAARYRVAMEGKQDSLLPEALAAADKAVGLDPKNPEALFNRALILQRMGLRDEARKAWERYLEVDADSGWSGEARSRLRQLQGQPAKLDQELFNSMTPETLARQFPQDTRLWGELVLLAEWADTVVAHDDAGAAARLNRARALAEALRNHNGEQLFADAVAAIDHADAGTRHTLAQAYLAYRAGRMSIDRNASAAETSLREAASLFTRGGSPMAQVARYYAAIAAFRQGRTAEAYADLEDIFAATDAGRHRALAAQVRRELAVTANALGDWGTATRHADAGIALFRELGETSNAAATDGLAAVALEMIGDRNLAWERRLRTFSGITDAGELDTYLYSSAWTLASRGSNAAATSMLDLRLARADRSDPVRLSLAYAEAVHLAWKNDDAPRAERTLASARAHAARIMDPKMRKTVEARIDLANAWRDGDARATIASLDRAIRHLAGAERRTLPHAFLRRAKARRALGDEESAAADLASGLREVEKQRGTISIASWQAMFLDVATQLIEETIELRLARNDPAGALDIADHARALLDPAPLDAAPPAVRPPLASGVALIEYAVLPKSTIAFCVANGTVTAHRIAVDSNDLDARIDDFARRIRRRADADAHAEALHRLLLTPLERRLAGARELVLVPDRRLHAVPFAALRNPATKKYLVEERTIRFAPSATFRRPAGGSLEPALVVVDPPRTEYRSLDASREEGASIAALYRATPLIGSAATRTAFAEGARRSSLIHYSGHANSDAGTSYGALLLAPSGSDDGIVGSGEIARLPLGHGPLVVLAACGTIRGDALHVSGMASISRAFLSAGARGVVGTLWEIEDDVSAPLFLKLHEHLRAGVAPAEALRRAQTHLLRSGYPHLAQPASWAAVEYLGNV